VIDAEEEELDEGDELTCEECGSNLTVVGKNPIEIEPTVDAEEEEDEDEDDDEDADEDEEEEDEDEDDDWK
jgi:alpha-aminoadipate carrier protein LysW